MGHYSEIPINCMAIKKAGRLLCYRYLHQVRLPDLIEGLRGSTGSPNVIKIKWLSICVDGEALI
jgi:hypothetical protein